MSDVAALRPSVRPIPIGLALILIPVAFAMAGLVLRYLGYATVSEDATVIKFAGAMCRWDCNWYVTLADTGYNPFPVPNNINAGNWAFFPLYPMLVAGLRTISGLSTIHAASVLSILLGMATARLAWPLLNRDLKAYTLFSAYLLAGPFSIWFTAFYTEILFVFLTVAVFVALQNRQFLLAGALAALLSATRIVGCLIVFAIVIEIWRAHREAGGTWRDFVPTALRRPDWILAVMIAPLGLFFYILYLHLSIGDGLAFSHVQRAWGRPSGLPPMFVFYAIFDFPESGWLPTPSQVLGAATLVGYGLALLLLVRRKVAMGVYSLLCLTGPLFAGMASMMRFTAALAPLALMLCQVLAANRWVFGISLLALLAGGYFAAYGWFSGYVALV
ncbi:MAG: hypothetical protein ACO1OG_05815 [Devosia sp.]